MKKRILLLKRFDHRDGNGTTTHYPPGDHGLFDEPLAHALVYEGFGVHAPGEPERIPVAEVEETAAYPDDTAIDPDSPQETKVVAPEETKPARKRAKK